MAGMYYSMWVDALNALYPAEKHDMRLTAKEARETTAACTRLLLSHGITPPDFSAGQGPEPDPYRTRRLLGKFVRKNTLRAFRGALPTGEYKGQTCLNF
jgi:hypothetical protein